MRRSYLNMQQPSTSNIPSAAGVIYPTSSFESPSPSGLTRLKRSRNSAFKDVQDSKHTVESVQKSLHTVCMVLQQYQQQLQNLAASHAALAQAQQAQAAHASVSALVQPIPQSPLTRARPPMSQPECPVALRPLPIASTCTTLSAAHFMNWPWNLPMGISSPPLQVPLPETPTSSAALPNVTASTVKLEGTVPETKWSSPSSVDSNGQKTDSTAVTDTTNIDIIGMDGSESTSSASTMAMVTSPDHHQQSVFTSTAQETASYFLQQTELGRNYPFEKSGSVSRLAMLPSEKKHRKQVSDDYVKLIRQQDLSDARVAQIQIPVPQAFRLDPDFKPNSEQQIIQQIVQNRRYEESNVRDSMIHLCKKLAEKRVFGAKLMAQTTVAGMNHSNYSNLPEEGIIYIQHVCRKVMGDKFQRDEDFWDAFREATKKLAARCRRVRHAKKNKTKDEAKPAPSELVSTLRSLNMPNLNENRTILNSDISTAAEALQNLSRSDPLNTLQAFTNLQNIVTSSLANSGLTAQQAASTWSSVLCSTSQAQPVKDEPDHDADQVFEAISP